jgi:hypothetical protein
LLLVKAIRRSHELGINPGGSVMSHGPISTEVMDANVPDGQRNVLLSKSDLQKIGGFVFAKDRKDI